MRYHVCLLLLAACYTAATAQIGLTTTYNIQDIYLSADDEAVAGSFSDFELDNGYEVQLHYWFRLPNNRIEFQPTVYYSLADPFGGSDVFWQEYGAQMEVNVYPFDFFGDCGCPTFGKQGPQLQKGFFIQGSAGYARREIEETFIASEVNTFVFGGGVGLDIGISNLLTLTPIATVRRGRAAVGDFSGIIDGGGNIIPALNYKQLDYQFGLQATFRFDSANY